MKPGCVTKIYKLETVSIVLDDCQFPTYVIIKPRGGYPLTDSYIGGEHDEKGDQVCGAILGRAV